MTVPSAPSPQPLGARHFPTPRRGPGWKDRLKGFGAPPRIVALDIARGLAVLGMIAAHTLEPTADFAWGDPSTWLDLVNGRSSILFALLAGVSVALMTGRRRVPTGAELRPLRLKLLGRGLLIFGIGLALECLGTPIAVILCLYGFLYTASVMVIGLRVRTLLIWAMALAVAGPLVVTTLTFLGDGDGLTFLLGGTYSIVVWAALLMGGMVLGRLDLTRRKVAAIGLAIGVVLSSVGYTVGTLWGADGDYGSSSEYSSAETDDDWPGESVPGSEVDLDGLTCDVYDGGDYVDCYPEEEVEGEPSSLSSSESSSFGEYPEDDGGWFAYAPWGEYADEDMDLADMFLSSYPHSGASMEIIGSGGFALALVCLLLLTGSSLRHVALPVAAIGSMPLSAYSAHVVLVWLLYGLWPAGEGSAGHFWIVTGLVVVGCTLWAVLVGKGPLERLSVRAAGRLSGAHPDRPH
jgi:hypothetical protein